MKLIFLSKSFPLEFSIFNRLNSYFSIYFLNFKIQKYRILVKQFFETLSTII